MPMRVMLLERRVRDRNDLHEASQRFHLSRREHETVCHLVNGLTTKEVAARMSISPDTVKQFVRLAMTKMGVSTRAGIVGKVLTPLSCERPSAGNDAHQHHDGRTRST